MLKRGKLDDGSRCRRWWDEAVLEERQRLDGVDLHRLCDVQHLGVVDCYLREQTVLMWLNIFAVLANLLAVAANGAAYACKHDKQAGG